MINYDIHETAVLMQWIGRVDGRMNPGRNRETHHAGTLPPIAGTVLF